MRLRGTGLSRCRQPVRGLYTVWWAGLARLEMRLPTLVDIIHPGRPKADLVVGGERRLVCLDRGLLGAYRRGEPGGGR